MKNTIAVCIAVSITGLLILFATLRYMDDHKDSFNNTKLNIVIHK